MDGQTEQTRDQTAEAWSFYKDQTLNLQDLSELDRQKLGKSFYRLAKLYYDKADLNKAEEFFLKALECTDAPSDFFPMLKILGFLVRIASEKLEDGRVGKYIEKSREILDGIIALKSPLNAEYFYYAGLLKTYTGEFAVAHENLQRSCKMAQEENNIGVLAKGLLALAITTYNSNDLSSALDTLNKLKVLLEKEGKDYLYGVMYYYRGKINLLEGDCKEALNDFEKSMEKLNSKGCWNLLGYLFLHKGMTCKAAGEYDKALLYYNNAVSCVNKNVFRQLSSQLNWEIEDVNDSSVDIYFDWTGRKVKERTQGIIDFKHRFILLEIFYLLIKNPGKYFNKEQLAQSIWENEYDPSIHDKLVYTSVSRLRKIIEPDSQEECRYKYIIRSKEGYTFNSKAKVRFCNNFFNSGEKSIANVELSSPV
ncbi:MAG: winged helix-turn-helix domain-containing protein [Halobacteriovoraceae bacterium]|nr:winged helix-turn-helix domain-containing protein [Halobacteriovoraceae bacterium]